MNDMKQPEALRLARELEGVYPVNIQDQEAAATELRRLHAEVERIAAIADDLQALCDRQALRIAALEQPQGEQEPVAWKWRYEDGELSEISFESRAECERRFAGYKGKSAPLYTHQQSPRQPLPPQADMPLTQEQLTVFKYGLKCAESAHGIGGKA